MLSPATDRSTEATLLELQSRLARMADHYARCSRLDREDLLQEAWLALLEASRAFDPQLGELTPYLLQRARWRMLDAIKYTRLRSFAAAAEPSEAVEAHGCAFRPEDSVDLAEFTARLTPLQQQIVNCLLQGLTWRETGERLEFSSANVAYHVREIRRRYLQWKKSHSEDGAFSAAEFEIDLEVKGQVTGNS